MACPQNAGDDEPRRRHRRPAHGQAHAGGRARPDGHRVPQHRARPERLATSSSRSRTRTGRSARSAPRTAASPAPAVQVTSDDAEVGSFALTRQVGGTPAQLLPADQRSSRALTGAGRHRPVRRSGRDAALRACSNRGRVLSTEITAGDQRSRSNGAHPIARSNVQRHSTATATAPLPSTARRAPTVPAARRERPGGGGGGVPRSRRRAWSADEPAGAASGPAEGRAHAPDARGLARPARTPAPPSAGRSARCRARRRSRAGRPAAPTRRAPRAGGAPAARATAAPSACGSRRPRPRSPGTTTSPCSASSAGTGRPRRRAARASEGRSPRGRRSSAGRSREGVFATRDAFHRNPRRAAGVTRRRR